MNDLKIENTITDLLNAEMIFDCRNSFQRQGQEKKSICALSQKKDFLSKYNLSIRYVFILLLKRGYDIYPDFVHQTFKEICIRVFEITEDVSDNIIESRHRKKYYNIKVPCKTQEFLDDILITLASKTNYGFFESFTEPSPVGTKKIIKKIKII